MDSESWRQVDELYHAALERPPAQRAAFVAERAPSEEVRREVISLLEQSASGERMLDGAAWDRGGIQGSTYDDGPPRFIRECNSVRIFSKPAWEPAVWAWSTAHGTRN